MVLQFDSEGTVTEFTKLKNKVANITLEDVLLCLRIKMLILQ